MFYFMAVSSLLAGMVAMALALIGRRRDGHFTRPGRAAVIISTICFLVVLLRLVAS